jgi:hypothetical protein
MPHRPDPDTLTSRGVGPVRGYRAWNALSSSAKAAQHRALDALRRMRTDHLSLPAAARAAGTTPATVRRFAQPALTTAAGRTVATPADRLYRRMSVLTPEGRQDIDVRGSRAAAKVSAHWNAAEHYLATGDTSRLDKFAGVRVGGAELATRPSDVERHWTRGELDIDDIYPYR